PQNDRTAGFDSHRSLRSENSGAGRGTGRRSHAVGDHRSGGNRPHGRRVPEKRIRANWSRFVFRHVAPILSRNSDGRRVMQTSPAQPLPIIGLFAGMIFAEITEIEAQQSTRPAGKPATKPRKAEVHRVKDERVPPAPVPERAPPMPLGVNIDGMTS